MVTKRRIKFSESTTQTFNEWSIVFSVTRIINELLMIDVYNGIFPYWCKIYPILGLWTPKLWIHNRNTTNRHDVYSWNRTLQAQKVCFHENTVTDWGVREKKNGKKNNKSVKKQQESTWALRPLVGPLPVVIARCGNLGNVVRSSTKSSIPNAISIRPQFRFQEGVVFCLFFLYIGYSLMSFSNALRHRTHAWAYVFVTCFCWCLQAILGGMHIACEKYDNKYFEKFRSQNIVELATEYARVMFVYHTWYMISFAWSFWHSCKC